MKFIQMDARNLQFKDAQFDAVIDKACLDAVICGDNVANVAMMMNEIYRVLKSTGTYICISHGKEDQRKKYLKNVKKYNWKRVKHAIQKPGLPNNKEIKPPKDDDKKNFNFMYVCTKQDKEQVIDSSDEEAVAAEKLRQAEKSAEENAKPESAEEQKN